MPENVLTQWEEIIRKVIDIPLTIDSEGNVISNELSFSQEAKQMINRWKNEVSNAAYSSTDSDAVRALCGKLEIYLIRYCLVIQIMHSICDGASMETSTSRVLNVRFCSRSISGLLKPGFHRNWKLVFLNRDMSNCSGESVTLSRLLKF